MLAETDVFIPELNWLSLLVDFVVAGGGANTVALEVTMGGTLELAGVD